MKYIELKWNKPRMYMNVEVRALVSILMNLLNTYFMSYYSMRLRIFFCVPYVDVTLRFYSTAVAHTSTVFNLNTIFEHF